MLGEEYGLLEVQSKHGETSSGMLAVKQDGISRADLPRVCAKNTPDRI